MKGLIQRTQGDTPSHVSPDGGTRAELTHGSQFSGQTVRFTPFDLLKHIVCEKKIDKLT